MNPSLSRLLEHLSDGEFCSGAAAGEMLGVSRTAVWKSLQKMGDMGLPIESVKGRGYRIPGGIELLSKSKIFAYLNDVVASDIRDLTVYLECESTNSLAMRTAVNGDAHGHIFLAEYQQLGRGRRGRRWVSPFGHNIYLSLVWKFAGGASQLEGLSLVVGIALARVLRQLGLQDTQLKWPNDVMVANKKIGGVLLEMLGDPAGESQVIIGVGLNVKMFDSDAIDQPWTAILEYLPHVSRNELVANLISELIEALHTFSVEGFAHYSSEWNRLDAYREQQVQVLSGNHSMHGVAKGVADNGALRVFDGEKEQLMYGGEISLRGIEQALSHET